MIEHLHSVGTRGLIKINDNTDGPEKTVDVWLASSTAKAVPQLPWTYSIDSSMSPWQQFNFKAVTSWQHLGVIFVGYAQTFTLHLGATGTAELDGPDDYPVELQSTVRTVSVKVGDIWKKAIPYVNVGGVWTPASPWVMSGGTWKETV